MRWKQSMRQFCIDTRPWNWPPSFVALLITSPQFSALTDRARPSNFPGTFANLRCRAPPSPTAAADYDRRLITVIIVLMPLTAQVKLYFMDC